MKRKTGTTVKRSLLTIGVVGSLMLIAAGCDNSVSSGEPGSLTPGGKAAFANEKCPMMGSPIDPSKVTAELTREFEGQKVAFCCPGCPAKWDKLSDAEKKQKLASARGAAGRSERKRRSSHMVAGKMKHTH